MAMKREHIGGKVVLGGEQGDLTDDYNPPINGGRTLADVESSSVQDLQPEQPQQLAAHAEGGVYKQAIDRIFAQMDRLDALEPGDNDSINAEVARSKAVMGLTNAMVGVSKEMREAISDQVMARRRR